MNIVERINGCFDSMTKSERQVAAHFLGHSSDFALLTLDRIASEVQMSTTTIIRFCRKLGFEGYKDFQESVRLDLKFHQPNLADKFQRNIDGGVADELLAQTIRQNISCIHQTFRDIPHPALTEAAKRIASADRLFTLGMRESYALAHYAYTRFMTIRSDTYILSVANGDIESVLNLKEGDVCLLFLFHRYTKQMLQLLPAIRQQGAFIIAVTSPPCDELEPYASVILPCRVDAGGIKNTAIAPVCLTDYLYNSVAMINGEKTLHHIKSTEDIFKANAILGS